MLLTLSAPTKPEFDFKPPHGSPTFFQSSSARSPSQVTGTSSFRSLPASDSRAMSAPHRGLPPPAAMTLPDPSRSNNDPSRGLPPTIPQWQGQMPAPPPQWQGAEESMRNWLHARAEEDKRKQEEEKTRQENLRLEQRKIEQSMLRETMQAGVPPHLIPVVFAGISGTNVGFEVLQNYYAQMQASLPQFQAAQQPHGSPDSRRDSRILSQPQTGAFATALPSQIPQHGPQQAASALQQSVFQATSMSPGRPRAHTTGHAGAQSSLRGPPGQSTLPRLTTNEMHIVQPPSAQQHPLQQSQTAQHESSQQQSSPSIYFHHWVPPTSQAGSGSGQGPPTPSGKTQSSSSQKHRHAPSHASESDYSSSPKKRKVQGGHQPVPPPTSAPQQTSPSFSQASSQASTPGRRGGGHSRTRSDASMRATEGSVGRPTSHAAVGVGSTGSARGSSMDRSRATSAERQAPHGLQHGYSASSTAVESEGGHSTQVGRSNYEFAGGPHETRQAALSAPGSPRRESAAGPGPSARPA